MRVFWFDQEHNLTFATKGKPNRGHTDGWEPQYKSPHLQTKPASIFAGANTLLRKVSESVFTMQMVRDFHKSPNKWKE